MRLFQQSPATFVSHDGDHEYHYYVDIHMIHVMEKKIQAVLGLVAVFAGLHLLFGRYRSSLATENKKRHGERGTQQR